MLIRRARGYLLTKIRKQEFLRPIGREARPAGWTMRSLKGRWALLLGLVAFGSILLAVPGIPQPLVGLLDAVSHSDGVAIRDAIRSYGFLAPAASIALILLHMVIPLPAELMALANGLAFGFWGGLAVSWSGFMLSALLMYAAGRLWGRPLLDRAVPRRAESGSTAGSSRKALFLCLRYAWYLSCLSTPFAWQRASSVPRSGPTSGPPASGYCPSAPAFHSWGAASAKAVFA